jgi:hypothetical protein
MTIIDLENLTDSHHYHMMLTVVKKVCLMLDSKGHFHSPVKLVCVIKSKEQN